MTKINWKVRFKNPVWVSSFFGLLIGFVFNMLALFDIYPSFSQAQVTMIVSQVLEFLGLIGVMVDPTTVGLSDSSRAMTYEEPWDDKKENEDPND
jgi:phi LC3 family holin